MRKLLLVVGLVLVLVPLAAAVALARGALIQCPNTLPCVATGSHDRVSSARARALGTT